MHFRYELEWNHDYFIIQYVNGDFMIEIGRYDGDEYQLHTEFIPFTIPNEHEGGHYEAAYTYYYCVFRKI